MTVRRLKVVLAIGVVLLWISLIRLARAFLGSELDWVAVAMYSRRDAPWYYRLAGVWGGLEGSLWLFTAIVATVALIGLRRSQSRLALAYAHGVIASFVAISLALVNPFRRLAVPAVGGFGLTPILEHPAMAVHPPLLYLGLASTLVVFLGVLSGDLTHIRYWLRLSLACVVAAMALGGLWSYVEQGWGGYWAWDPVENTSLMVWLGVLMALHAQPLWSQRTGRLMLMLPWILTVGGAAIVRSGSVPSIHGFGQRAAVGWSLLGCLAVTCGLVAVFVARHQRHQRLTLGAMAMNVRIVLLVLGVTAAGTLTPIIVDLVSDRPTAVRGSFYSAFIGPAALIAVPFLVVRLRRTGRRGWIAHVGALVLLSGIAASTFDTKEVVVIASGASARVAGIEVTNVAVRVDPGPRQQSASVVAVLDVGGQRMEPALVAFSDRGGRLHENDLDVGVWRDVQVQLDTANDAGVITLTVYIRPLMWLVWLGAVLIAVGALITRRRRVIDSVPAGALVCELTNH
jgi:cytochrome c-type biogenesis protein NrfE